MEGKLLRDWFRFTEVDAADYERLRPDYAPEAGEWLAEQTGLGSDSVVLDLGAGTGKLTRLRVGKAGKEVALEPAANMLAVVRDAVAHAVAQEGTGEAMRVPDRAVH